MMPCQNPIAAMPTGSVWRNEKPGPGRFRQFTQFDADTVGAPVGAADAEMCMLMADVMEAVGIKRGDYMIRVNNRKIFDGIMIAIGLGDEVRARCAVASPYCAPSTSSINLAPKVLSCLLGQRAQRRERRLHQRGRT